MLKRRSLSHLALILPMSTAACVSTQVIPLDCVPDEVSIYVDGRLIDRDDVLTLSQDEPHKLYFKQPGHEPTLVVLESMMGPDGTPRLDAEDACVTLVPVGVGREVTLEPDEDGE